MMAGYTYGKSLDDSSSLSEPIYPMGADLTKAISAFDLRHNFVVSYRYESAIRGDLPRAESLTTGWSLSGITRFSTGLPVTLYNNTDSSLLGTHAQRHQQQRRRYALLHSGQSGDSTAIRAIGRSGIQYRLCSRPT